MIVAAAPAWADPEDPPPPDKSGEVQQAVAQEPAPAPAMESAAPSPQAQIPASKLIDDHVGPPELWWVHGEYMLWWIKNGPLPQSLLTTGSPSGGGVLGDPSTSILLGNSTIDYGKASGFRFGGGGWLGERHIWGLEGDGFFLQQKTVNRIFASDANGNPLLARPINDALANFAPEAVQVAAPGSFAGSFAMSSTSRLWGAEVNVVRNLYASPRFRADMLFGFHYLDLSESLQLTQETTALANGRLNFPAQLEGPNPPNILSETLMDGFHTRNQVYAGQLGMRFDGHFGAASLLVTTKVAFGPNHQTVVTAGSTTANFADGTSATAPGGLLALPGTNIGQVNNNPFVIVPQVDVRLGYHATDWLQFFIGYDFLFVNEVARPGSQITLNVNTGLVPASPNFGSAIGPNEPSHQTKRDEFWAQGLTFGIEFRY